MSYENNAQETVTDQAPEIEAHGVLGLQKLETKKGTGFTPIEVFSCSSCGAMSC